MKRSDTIPAEIEPRKAPVQERSRLRFEKILEVSTELITQKGVESVSMSEIAEQAQISLASLYQYFPEKVSIIATLARRYNEYGQTCVQQAFEHAASYPQIVASLREMVRTYYEFFVKVPGGKPVWHAMQSDPRLLAIDYEDCDLHAQTIQKALMRSLSGLPEQDAYRIGHMFTNLVALTVRTAIDMPADEADCYIEEGIALFILPALDAVFAKYQ